MSFGNSRNEGGAQALARSRSCVDSKFNWFYSTTFSFINGLSFTSIPLDHADIAEWMIEELILIQNLDEFEPNVNYFWLPIIINLVAMIVLLFVPNNFG